MNGLKTIALPTLARSAGPIPTHICQLGSCLVELGLGANKLDGERLQFPMCCLAQHQLNTHVDANRQHSLCAGRIPTEVGRLLELKQLELGDNELTGSCAQIAARVPKRHTRVMTASIRFVGPIPSEIGDIGQQLERLQLHNNKLTGPPTHAHTYVGSPLTLKPCSTGWHPRDAQGVSQCPWTAWMVSDI